MSFDVPADAYDRFMGRYSGPLSSRLADFAGVRAGRRVLDVGCGPGALTAELVSRVGASAVSAVDPAGRFVAAARARNPSVRVELAPAERLPFPHDAFDVALAQLVVNFMADPRAGLAEMRRVTRPGGIVAACVWAHAEGRGPLSPFWDAARQIDSSTRDESELPGSRQGDLSRLFESAGLSDVEETALSVSVEHPTFDEWWEPFTFGVGTAGAHLASLDPEHQAQLRERCRAVLPDPPFVFTASAWGARGIA